MPNMDVGKSFNQDEPLCCIRCNKTYPRSQFRWNTFTQSRVCLHCKPYPPDPLQIPACPRCKRRPADGHDGWCPNNNNNRIDETEGRTNS